MNEMGVEKNNGGVALKRSLLGGEKISTKSGDAILQKNGLLSPSVNSDEVEEDEEDGADAGTSVQAGADVNGSVVGITCASQTKEGDSVDGFVMSGKKSKRPTKIYPAPNLVSRKTFGVSADESLDDDGLIEVDFENDFGDNQLTATLKNSSSEGHKGCKCSGRNTDDTESAAQKVVPDTTNESNDLKIVEQKREGETNVKSDECGATELPSVCCDNDFNYCLASAENTIASNTCHTPEICTDDAQSVKNSSVIMKEMDGIEGKDGGEIWERNEQNGKEPSLEAVGGTGKREDVVVRGRERAKSALEMKAETFAKLQEELSKAQRELKLRDEEVTRLSRIREEVEAELEELTASLFQEAHSMVREANIKQASAEKALKEAQMKIEVLQAEVAALKTLVITSTPSMPNKHLHPQIDSKTNKEKEQSSGIFNRKGHRRSPSHYNLKYGRENTPPSSPEKEQQPPIPTDLPFEREQCEVDPIYHKEFVSWRQSPTLDRSHSFLARMYREDIDLCLNFSNRDLSLQMEKAIHDNTIFIEAESGKTPFPKKCALLEAPRLCRYRMKLGDSEHWYPISQLCRNRITAVCDFLNYLRYIQLGLVKSSVHDVYWEIIRLRRQMALARLGIQ